MGTLKPKQIYFEVQHMYSWLKYPEKEMKEHSINLIPLLTSLTKKKTFHLFSIPHISTPIWNITALFGCLRLICIQTWGWSKGSWDMWRPADAIHNSFVSEECVERLSMRNIPLRKKMQSSIFNPIHKRQQYFL